MLERYASEKLAVAASQGAKEREYWLNKLSDELSRSYFPYDHKPKDKKERSMKTLRFVFEGDIFTRLIRLSNASDYRVHMVLVSGLVILLHKYTGNNDIIIGVPIYKQQIEGEFINTVLALRHRCQDSMIFKELLLQSKDIIIEANENANYPIETLLHQLGISFSEEDFSLFDIAILLENIHDKKYLQNISLNMIFSCFRTEKTIEGVVEYNASLYKKSTIKRIITHFLNLLKKVLSDVDLRLTDINILSESEQKQLLFDFNDTDAAYPRDKTIHQLFEEQVKRNPDNIAVIAAWRRLQGIDKHTGAYGGHITYCDLNRRANQLARGLRARGVKADIIAGIMEEHSIEMIIGILGILKSGGAYLPIDPEHPRHRIEFKLKDSGADVLLITENFNADFSKAKVYLSNSQNYQGDIGNLGKVSNSSNLAYIIYTSGTTGRPKGVMIEHRNVVRLMANDKFLFDFDNRDVWTMFHSLCFDFSVWEMYGALLFGGKLVVISRMMARDTERFLELLRMEKVTVLNQTPSAFYHLMNTEKANQRGALILRYVIFGGEALIPAILKEWKSMYPETKLINMYGITETTVHVTYKEIKDKDIALNISNIGKPIPTATTYIMDKNLKLVPLGVPGELCVGGEGLGRSYLNSPGLAAERFTKNPYKSGEIIYKSGDLAKFLENGEIEFIGRLDHQVKIRGYRIELGEIENQLLKLEAIKGVVVVDRENEKKEKHLYAYFTADREISAAKLRAHLYLTLPAYMIPSYFVHLDRIPLNPNGKLDRKALPASDSKCGAAYAPPKNELEETVADIWKEVLGLDHVGVHDNFFMIGGDSIKSIQILSRLNKFGYKAEMKYLFQYPTISTLVPFIKKLEGTPKQSLITGVLPLTPIQKEFFKISGIDSHYFNQAVMLYSEAGFEDEVTKEVFIKLQEHHDALRITYNEVNGEIIQTNHGLDIPISLQVFDFRNKINAQKELEVNSNEIQASIDLENGPLMKIGLFHLSDGDRLLIVIHHLVVDGVSWRIILEDFETLYNQHKNGTPLVLPAKTDSFKHWSELLYEYANDRQFLKEKTYWMVLESSIGEDDILKTENDFKKKFNYIEDAEQQSFSLSEEDTELLLTKVNSAYNTEINDILLTALGLGIKKFFGNEKILIALEGHGREDIFRDVDISRTVGWFTTKYPVLLDMNYSYEVGLQIKHIKEQLRQVPNKGIGYGILKYLTLEEYKREIDFKLNPQISFNYLGQFDAEVKKKSFRIAEEPIGDTQSIRRQREYEIDIAGIIANSQLNLSITYNKKQYKPENIMILLNNYKSELRHIIAYCSSKEKREVTPSDLTFKGLSINKLDQLLVKYQIEDIYTLSPMQEGILFHALSDNTSSVYFEQISFRLHGELYESLVERSLNKLFKRHNTLRSLFIYEGIELPIQVVLKERKVDFYTGDIYSINNIVDREKSLEEFRRKDRSQPFDLKNDVLMRASIIKVGELEYELIWSYHHILFDGWSFAMLISEFFEIYNSFIENREPELSTPAPYRTYLVWLEKQDNESSKIYWFKYLENYEKIAIIPNFNSINTKEKYKDEHFNLILEYEITKKLEKLAVKNKVTLNTIIQTVWGIILARYNRSDDVVFGAVVSGRPPIIDGIESMVGLFINTIPVRIRYEEKAKFSQLLYKVQGDAIDSEPHHYYSLAQIQSGSNLKQNLFNHILVFENYPIALHLENEIRMRISNIKIVEQTNYNLNIIITPGDRLFIKFKYNNYVYEKKWVKAISKHFKTLLEQILNEPDSSISKLSLLSEKNKREILYDINNTKSEYPRNKTIHKLFEEQVERTGHKIAVISMAQGAERISDGEYMHTHKRTTDRETERCALTYGELNRKSDQLAALLIEKGVTSGDIVGIIGKRSMEMVVGILGILKAGGAYLPIDVDYPEERKQYMLADSSARVLLNGVSEVSDRELTCLYPEVIDLNKISEDSEPLPTHPLPPFHSPNQISSESTAYIMYTSGSTGRPNGVVVTHRNVVRLVKNTNYVALGEGTRILQTGAYVFDATTFEIWGSLLNGGQLVLVDKEMILDAHRLADALKEYDVNTLWLTSPLFNQLMQQNIELFSPLRYLLVGGDVLSPSHINRVKRKFPGLYIINGYGPAENTTFSTTYLIDKKHKENIPIGKSILNSTAYIVDANNNLVPVGILGELFVGGDGLARGYLNNPELTVEKFIENPFIEGEKLYKTGDLARWLPDGNIAFLGRIDHQVKIRGFRIELGEIENRMRMHGGVKEAFVVSRSDRAENMLLCAYVVPKALSAFDQTPLDIMELKEYLSQTLPDYMIPSYFVKIEKIPLTPNGKVDRRALPQPETSTGEAYVAPQNEIERILAKVWSEVLGIKKETIGIDDNFFHLGGHSLKAMVLVSKIYKELNIKMPLEMLFRTPTIRGLSKYIKEAESDEYISIGIAEKREYHLLSPAQKRLYVLQQIDLKSTAYNIPTAMILDGHIDKGKIEHTFVKLIKGHESLRISFEVIEEMPVQKIHNKVQFSIEYYDAEVKEEDGEKVPNTSFIINNFVRPFDLSQTSLLRVGLIKENKSMHILMIDMHHIISDGTSTEILTKDFMTLYSGEGLHPLRLQYKDFSEWQVKLIKSGQLEKQEKFWLREFAGDIPVLELASDYPRPAIKNFEGSTIEFELGAKETNALKDIAEKEGATLFMVLLAVYYILLSKLSGQEDIVVGTFTAGRRHADLQKVIGMFVNTLPLRNYPSGEKKFKLFLREVKEKTLEAFENQEYPFEDIVEKVKVNRDTGRNPLIDVIFTLQNQEVSPIEIPGLKLKPYNFETGISKFDLTLQAVEKGNHLLFSVEYSTKLFKKETIKRFINYFKHILSSVTGNNEIKLKDIDILHDLIEMERNVFREDEGDFGF